MWDFLFGQKVVTTTTTRVRKFEYGDNIYGFQQEKTYTEEDMLKFMQFIISNEELENTSSVSIDTAKYYLKEFKAKKL